MASITSIASAVLTHRPAALTATQQKMLEPRAPSKGSITSVASSINVNVNRNLTETQRKLLETPSPKLIGLTPAMARRVAHALDKFETSRK